MTVFVCENSFEGVLTGIYDAWASKIKHYDLRIECGPIEQRELFAEYREVPSDSNKASKVMKSIRTKISYEAYHRCLYTAMSAMKDRGDVIYRFLLLGFTVGAPITKCLAEPSVMTLFEYSRKYSNEAHYYKEFIRFTKSDEGIYVSHISPSGDVIPVVGEHFADRMPSEHFMIIDDNRHKAVIHPKDQENYIRVLTLEDFLALKDFDKKKDRYTDLWQLFFEQIAIKERENPVCQRNHLPLHFRKHMTEFISGN